MRADKLSTAVAGWWRWTLVAGIAVLCILAAAAIVRYNAFSQASVDVQQSDAVTRAVDQLLVVLIDAETGYRGYLLTANRVFLETYLGADVRARDAVVALTALVASDVGRRDALSELSGLVEEKLAEMTTTMARFDAGERDAAIAVVRSASGKRIMDDIRQLGGKLKSEERTVATSRAAQAAYAARAARRFGVAAVVMVMLLMLVGWSISRTMEQRRQEVAAASIAQLEAERDATISAADLAQSESFNRSLLDSSRDAVALLSPNGEMTFLNQAGVQFMALPAEDAWRQAPFAGLWPEHGDAAEVAVRAAVSSGEGRFVASHVDRQSTRRWWDVIVTPVRSGDGRVLRLVATARDVTLQKLADEERQMLLASERSARSEAERAARIKDDFVSTLSHELRTPLNAILGWVGVLRQDQASETVAKALDVIDRNSRRQSQMIDDLLDMGRILSGKMRLEVTRVEVASVIDEALLSAQPSADAKGVRLLKALGSASVVRGDSGRLQQVVWNLLSNAIKFTPRGGQVQVTLRKVNSQVHIQVSDTGSGIPAELVGQVFDRFRQGDQSTTRRHGGLGLGLSIVKSLVELHGGTVEAASDGVNTGATFTVRLPLALASPYQEPRPGDTTAPVGTTTSLERLRVLVLDDEEDAREVVKRLLEDAGATVTASASASDAEGLLLSGLVPDVIVSDVGMPERDGYEFIQAVRNMPPPLGSVPAAALTALARLEDRKRALLSGFQTHLAKPVDPAELVATVASLAGRTGRR